MASTSKRKPRKVVPKRGPVRSKGIKGKVCIVCGYKSCRRKDIDCKNRPHQLERKKVNESMCRPLRPQAALVKFCSSEHMKKCQKKDTQRRGGREALSSEQIASFFKTIIYKAHAPWAGVLLLVQLLLGDRADCARQARIDWFCHLHPDAKGLPEAIIPTGINGKTQPRHVPLPTNFARLLWAWIAQHPLESEKKQWPLEGQDLHGAYFGGGQMFLFCGRSGQGHNNIVWDKPISERAYLKQISNACEIISRERMECNRAHRTHVFDEVDLSRVGTHSWKKSAVTLLKDQRISTAVISVLTGTSIKTLNEVYDVPTLKRRRQAVNTVFSPVAEQIDLRTSNATACARSSETSRHAGQSEPSCCQPDRCIQCDTSSMQGNRARGWRYCPHCGLPLARAKTQQQ